MRVRRREVVWLCALGALLLVVRGMDSRASSLRRASRAATADAAAAVAAAGATTGATPAPAAAEAGAVLTASELASLAWGPNPFARGGAGRSLAAPGLVGGTERAPETGSAPPVYQGLAKVRGRLLAALDGGFHAPGDRVGEWLVQEIVAGGVTVRNVRTGDVRRLTRDRAESAP